jgi:hypothetical protein
MDTAARKLLTRVYKADGGWAATRLADPSPRQLAHWLSQGVNVLGKDPVPPGGFRAYNHWARSYTRALWYQHKWFSGDPDTGGWRSERRTSMRWPGIEVEFGRHRPALGVIPAGRPVRVRLADKRAARKRDRPESQWAWADNGPRKSPGSSF